MKRVYSLLLAAALLLAGVQANAQFSLTANYMYTMERSKTEAGASMAARHGANAGFFYNIPLGGSEFWGIQPGFNASFSLGKETGAEGNEDLGAGLTANYTEVLLNLPVNLTLGYNADADFNVFFFVGPVIQFGVMSQSRITGNGTMKGFVIDKPYTFDHYKGDTTNNIAADRKPFNLYINAGLGIQIGDYIQLLAGYEYGFLNYSADAGKTLNRSHIKAGLAIGF